MSNAIFVMNFMTNTAYESECDVPSRYDASLEDAAAPEVSAISVTDSDLWIDACRKIVEDKLASEDEDLYDEGEEISPYTWEDGEWTVPEEGFAHRIFTVMQDGLPAAAMVIQRRPTFG